MIFTVCVACDSPLVVHYEAGDGTTGTFERVVCSCFNENFVEHVSVGGRTLTRHEFFKLYPDASRKRVRFDDADA